MPFLSGGTLRPCKYLSVALTDASASHRHLPSVFLPRLHGPRRPPRVRRAPPFCLMACWILMPPYSVTVALTEYPGLCFWGTISYLSGDCDFKGHLGGGIPRLPALSPFFQHFYMIWSFPLGAGGGGGVEFLGCPSTWTRRTSSALWDPSSAW